MSFPPMIPALAYDQHSINIQAFLMRDRLESLQQYRNFQAYHQQRLNEAYSYHHLLKVQLSKEICTFDTPLNVKEEHTQSQVSELSMTQQQIPCKAEECEFKTLSTTDTHNSERSQEVDESDLKTQITNMVQFLHTQFGKASKEEIQQHRKLYTNSSHNLIELFDNLTEKYLSAGKCREDMIRFVIRKAIGWLRDSLRDKNNLSSKAASMALCRKYFQTQIDHIRGKNVAMYDQEEVMSFLLPYKKNSRNRTANSCFITEIFASEAFHEDYIEFLGSFDEILEADNAKKNEKLISFLVKCVEEKCIHKVKTFKRLPWLKTWLESTKVLAYELLHNNAWSVTNKKVKTNMTSSKKK